jgi:hypothetical protein
LAIATLAVGSAQAGTPMNVLERKAAADAMARQYQAQQAAQGDATTPSANASEVPDDLHNYLHARVDANGKVRILETDGKTAPPKQEANHE